MGLRENEDLCAEEMISYSGRGGFYNSSSSVVSVCVCVCVYIGKDSLNSNGQHNILSEMISYRETSQGRL